MPKDLRGYGHTLSSPHLDEHRAANPPARVGVSFAQCYNIRSPLAALAFLDSVAAWALGSLDAMGSWDSVASWDAQGLGLWVQTLRRTE